MIIAVLLGIVGVLTGGHAYIAWTLDAEGDVLADLPASLAAVGIAVVGCAALAWGAR